jgi:hypothetical protein
MFWLPEDSVEVVNLPTPELRVTVVSVVVPSMKVTVPVSVPPNCPAPLVEKVTDCPNFMELLEAEMDSYEQEELSVYNYVLFGRRS